MRAHTIDGRLVEDLILTAADRVLGGEETRRLKARLSVCAACAELALQHSRLARRLAAAVPSVGAQQVSLVRIYDADARKSSSLSSTRAAMLAAAIAAILVASLGVREGVGRLQVPERELVVERIEPIGDDQVLLEIQDGRFAAAPGRSSGVVASAAVHLSRPRTGTAELRFARPGETYGVLATVADIRNLGRFRMEHVVPEYDSATVLEVWLHLEGADNVDSPRIVVQVEPRFGGQRARPYQP